MVGVDCGYGVEDCLGTPWDSLGEQAWGSLDNSDTASLWEGEGNHGLGSLPVDDMAALNSDDFASQRHDQGIIYNYASGDASAESYDSWGARPQAANGLGGGGAGNSNHRVIDDAMRSNAAAHRGHWGRMDVQHHHDTGYAGAGSSSRAPSAGMHDVRGHVTSSGRGYPGGYPPVKSEAMGSRQGGAGSGVLEGEVLAPRQSAPSGKSSLFMVNLYVVAVTDYPLAPGTPPKMAQMLEQVRRKVSKEHTMTVSLRGEGPVEVRMCLFAVNSAEAACVSDYVTCNRNQAPAPFSVLSQLLPIALSFDAALVDPTLASVADRLRHQANIHAVQLLHDACTDRRSLLTTHMLCGGAGPFAIQRSLAHFLAERAVSAEADLSKRYLTLPAKIRAPVGTPAGSPKAARAPKAPRALSLEIPQVHGQNLQGLSPQSALHSPTSAPSTPSTAGDGEEDMWGDRPTAYFPVSLFVTAIADGELANDVPHKSLDRLMQIVRKVPKEQNTSVEVAEGHTIDLKMRVFVVNSEDAKAVGDYMTNHMGQHPAPFVLLARHIPMAVLYDPSTLDLADASVADRLRKQAKTRTVKVLREGIANKSLGVTAAMLRGHMGPLEPAQRLEGALRALCQLVEGDCGGGEIGRGNFIVFTARNKTTGSAPSSPRRRTTPGSSVNKRGASASQLHRKILDKALKKQKKSTTPRSSPDTPPSMTPGNSAIISPLGFGRAL